MIEKTEMRSQFEAQFIEEYVRVLGEGVRELAAHTLATNPPLVSMSWWAWQASRESVVAEIGKIRSEAKRQEDGLRDMLRRQNKQICALRGKS
ncbi:hypothetical protein LOY24_17980 [Pseudomonas putida]|uniref:hypothetical protein n=1 Tax=Pseudomonas putida TaxID=303 RepID=UPI00215F816D|nr:hypothetical protein [Pseudomonas putida]UVL76614.1 hypothetical protein LOY24_17980 [Pseudomonas putida]